MKRTLNKAVKAMVIATLSLTMVGAMSSCDVLDPILQPILGIFGQTPEEPTTITLKETEVTIGIGDSKRVTAEVTNQPDDQKVVWTSSDEAVATVSEAGVVRGVAAGTATITATINGVSATCKVTVQDITVSLDKAELALDVEIEAEKSATLTATVKNGDSVVEEEIAWSSSDESVATVDENGKVTAVGMGTATITAKRKTGNASATCEVTVGWKNMPEGYAEIGFSEQNKAVTNTYGIWNDQGWEFGNTALYNAYYANSEGSMAGKVFMDYEVLSTMKDEVQAAVQLTLRSSKATGDEGALLDVGYFYTLSLDITSSASGTIHVNDYAVNSEVEGLEDEVYEFEVEAGVTKHIEVKFAHYDDGRIHDTTDYSNVESALHVLLGSLEGRVQVTIDNLQWVKGDEAPARPNTTPPAPVVTVPDLSDVDAISLGFSEENIDHGQATANGTYTVTDNGEGKSYTVAYENAPGGTYENLFASLENVASVATGNTFSATVTNNGETDMKIRFDIAGEVAAHGGFAEARDCALSSVAVDSEGNSVAVSTDTTYDGTQFTVAAGKTVTVYITYTTEGVNGIPTELLVYFDTSTYQDTNTYSGNVTISEFKFANVEKEEAPAVEYEEPVAVNATEYVKGDEANSVANAGKIYYWYAEDLSWNCGAVIEVSDVKLENGAFTFSYKSTGSDPAPAFYGMQLFYKNASNVTGNTYKVTFTLNSTAAGDITVNGQVITLVVGENKIEVEYTETAADASLDIQFGTAAAGNFVDNNTVTISDLAFAGQKGADEGEGEVDENATVVTFSSASLKVVDGKVYYVVIGKAGSAYYGENATALKVAASFQHNNNVSGLGWGRILTYADNNNMTSDIGDDHVLLPAVNATVAEDGTFEALFDISSFEVGYVMTVHAGLDGALADYKHGNGDGVMVTLDGKRYSIKCDGETWDISAVKVEDASTPALIVTNRNAVELVEENGKMYYVIKGTYANYTEDQIKELAKVDFEPGEGSSGEWTYMTAEDYVLTVNEGSFVLKVDITDLSAGYYWVHAFKGFGQENGDINSATATAAITCGDKTYAYVNHKYSWGEAMNLTIDVYFEDSELEEIAAPTEFQSTETKATLTKGEGEHQVTVFEAKKTDATINVDGSLDDAYLAVKPIAITTSVEGSNSATGYAYVLWDANYLYVFVVVNDANVAKYTNGDRWNTDSVELYIDSWNKATAYDQHYGGDYRGDYCGEAQLRMNVGEQSIASGSHWIWDNAGVEKFGVSKVIEGGYTVEYKVAWADFEAEAGKQIAFSVLINDGANNARTGVVGLDAEQNHAWEWAGVLSKLNLVADAAADDAE